jgi:hypothetical protein
MNKYYKLSIIKTSKPMGNSQESYRSFDDEVLYFDTLDEIKTYLSETYGKCKRIKSYVDTKNGAKQAGWIYCFKNSDYSHAPIESWYQQDWTDIFEIHSKRINI